MKKKNPNKISLTKADLNKAERKYARELQQVKREAAMDATRYVQAIWYLAVHNVFDFGAEEIAKIQEEADRIASSISGDTEYSFLDVVEELKEIGVMFER